MCSFFFFFNDLATTDIYTYCHTLSLPDALPIFWLPATLMAGAVQAWRTAVQRRVSHSLSLNAAGLVRYLYGLPFTCLLLGGYRLLFPTRSEEHTSELQSLMRISYAVFCLKKKKDNNQYKNDIVSDTIKTT